MQIFVGDVYYQSDCAVWRVDWKMWKAIHKFKRLDLIGSPELFLPTETAFKNRDCVFEIRLEEPSGEDEDTTYLLKLLGDPLQRIAIFSSTCAKCTMEMRCSSRATLRFRKDHLKSCECEKSGTFADKLRFCIFTSDRDIEHSSPANASGTDDTQRSAGVTKLISDLKEILLSEKDSDVVLKVEGRWFKAHKLILGSRSPVFAAMFGHEMKEKNCGKAVIEDCNCETFQDLLHYIYTGNVENLSPDRAPQLYKAADKYLLMELKQECLEYMKNNVSVDNFCDIISISHRHQETQLTRIANEFLRNSAHIVTTVKWAKFLS